jgi:phosphatidate cytidylyltransferase
MRRYERPGGVTANLSASIFSLTYVAFLLSYAVELRLQWGVTALASLLIIVKMGDTGAYTVGRLIGRHKMTPTLSPGKTIEGAVGALAFSIAASWVVFQWLVPASQSGGEASSIWGGWAVYGAILGVVGILGDLAESLLKRDVGVKDSSTWLPGFGGVLDMLDSVLIAAPFAYACWAFRLVG